MDHREVPDAELISRFDQPSSKTVSVQDDVLVHFWAIVCLTNFPRYTAYDDGPNGPDLNSESRCKKGFSKKEIRKLALPEIPAGRIPRITRCMGLAIHYEALLRACALKEYPLQSDQTERFNPFQSIDDGLSI
ncbi:MAG: hypothetical protein NTW52_00385 [Planctomycetota bacterium]|nr:hypothetical protein [Planctomycetota bacterium]